MILLGLVGGLLHVTDPGHAGGLSGWHWLLIGVLVGVLLGLLMSVLVGLDFKRDELFLFVLGVVAMSSGLALFLHLPAVFLSFVAGVTAANTAWHREEIHKISARAEKPIYLTFLVLTGTQLVLDDLRVVSIAVIVVLLGRSGTCRRCRPGCPGCGRPERSPGRCRTLRGRAARAHPTTARCGR